MEIRKERDCFYITTTNKDLITVNLTNHTIFNEKTKRPLKSFRKLEDDWYFGSLKSTCFDKVRKEPTKENMTTLLFVQHPYKFFENSTLYEAVGTIFADREYNRIDRIIDFMEEFQLVPNAKNFKMIKAFEEEFNNLENGNISFLNYLRLKYTTKDSNVDERIFNYIGCDYVFWNIEDFGKIVLRDSHKIVETLERENVKEFCEIFEIEIGNLIEEYIKNFQFVRQTDKIEYKNFIETYKKLYLVRKELEEKLVVDYQNKVKYENDKYITIIPTTAQDFVNEGNAQHNCVGGYFRYVKDQTSYVVFIRDKEDIEHSLITCEITKNGRIRQYLKKYNSNKLTEEEQAFKEEYEKYLMELLAK